MRSHRTSLFTYSLCLAGTICALFASSLSASAQTAPRYVGRYMDGAGDPNGYYAFTDSGVLYSVKNVSTGEYTRWENGVLTTHTFPTGSGARIIAANDAGMILWYKSPNNVGSVYLQYPDNSFDTVYQNNGFVGVDNPQSLNEQGTVAITSTAGDYLLTNPRTRFTKSFFNPAYPNPGTFQFAPFCINNSNDALSNVSRRVGESTYRFWIYRAANDSIQDVEAPVYGSGNNVRQYYPSLVGFNDYDEVAGALTPDWPYETYFFIYLPNAKYGLNAGINFLTQHSSAVVGLNNKGQLCATQYVWQNGTWYPLNGQLNSFGARRINNAGQILGAYNGGGGTYFYLLTQVINVHGHLNNPGNPPAQILVTFQPNDASLPFTRTVTPDPSGDFIVADVPTRSYTATFSIPNRLRRHAAIDATQNNDDITLAPFDLLRGDANGDNAVDILDLLLLIAHYNQSQGTGDYLQACDFNTDGANDIADLLILIANYNQFGE